MTFEEQRRAILKGLRFAEMYGTPWKDYVHFRNRYFQGLRHLTKDDDEVIDSTARVVEPEPEPLALPAPREPKQPSPRDFGLDFLTFTEYAAWRKEQGKEYRPSNQEKDYIFAIHDALNGRT